MDGQETKERKLISIVVPCYNEALALPYFNEEMTRVAATMNADFEFLFVDDGSKDNTLEVIRSMADNDRRVRYISFSRNFGKESAMLAGLANAKGDYVAIMDADLQDPPALLPEMFAAVDSGEYDCVATRRSTRKGEPFMRSLFARIFYRIMKRISRTEMVEGARDFRLMSRRMTDAVLSVQEYNRFTKGIYSWVGFKTKWLEYENIERVAGKTTFNFWKLFLYSLECIFAYSTAPLAFASVCGFVFTFGSLLGIVVVIVRELIWQGSANGWPSLVCLILLVSGLQLFSIGILGQYLSRTYLETKRRPIYIIRETEISRDRR